MIKKLSIILPVFNEANTLEKTIQAVWDYFGKQKFDYEVIVVDDGSTDDTQKILKILKNDFPSLVTLKCKSNKGKGAAVRLGVLEARGDWVLFMDADLSTPLNTIEKFLGFTDRFDIIIGSRALPTSEVLVRQFILKEWLGKLGNFFIKRALDLPFRDTQCGFKMFSRRSRELFSLQTVNRWGFDFEILALAQSRNLKVKELAVTWVNVAESKVKLRDYWGTFQELLAVKRGINKI